MQGVKRKLIWSSRLEYKSHITCVWFHYFWFLDMVHVIICIFLLLISWYGACYMYFVAIDFLIWCMLYVFCCYGFLDMVHVICILLLLISWYGACYMYFVTIDLFPIFSFIVLGFSVALLYNFSLIPSPCYKGHWSIMKDITVRHPLILY